MRVAGTRQRLAAVVRLDDVEAGVLKKERERACGVDVDDALEVALGEPAVGRIADDPEVPLCETERRVRVAVRAEEHDRLLAASVDGGALAFGPHAARFASELSEHHVGAAVSLQPGVDA